MIMNFFSRRTAIVAMSALALAACGNDAKSTPPAGNGGGKPVNTELGHLKGSPDAPVTLIEYASPTCPACKYWHDSILPVVEEEYIATGKVKLIYREFPLHQPDVPAYLVAMCAREDKYFDVLDELFEYQSGILDAARNGVLKAALQTIGQRHGIETEEQFDACMNDSSLRTQMADVYATAEKYNVTGTPTFVIDGKVQQFERMNSADRVKASLNEALAAKGVDAPAAAEPAESGDTDTTDSE